MNFADIKQYDVANGTGVRVSVFVSGCEHYCKNCFNVEAWDFDYGEPFTEKTLEQIVEYLKPYYVQGLSILGGEPLHPRNREQVLKLIRAVKTFYPTKTVWVYTGYTFEDILPQTQEIMSYIDVLVDGKFVEELKDLRLKFKGSSNQRTILVQASLRSGSVICKEV